MSRNLSDEQQIAQNAAEYKKRAAAKEAELRMLLDNSTFRSLIWRIFEDGGLNSKLWTTDENELIRRVAVRDFVKNLWEDCEKANLEKVFEMINDAKKGVMNA